MKRAHAVVWTLGYEGFGHDAAPATFPESLGERSLRFSYESDATSRYLARRTDGSETRTR
jgi:hypothetical protein